MSVPTIEVLGVYPIKVCDEVLKVQTNILYGSHLTGSDRQAAETECRLQLGSTVLVETLVRNRDGKFKAADFAQPRPGLSYDNWQVAWCETYLSVDGEYRLDAQWPHPPDVKDFRVAFFIHYWDPNLPFISSYGELKAPPVQKMPERLKRLVPYEPVD
ncbi:MAG: hypothetical protein WD851_12940 [Pirellulales bacterium]